MDESLNHFKFARFSFFLKAIGDIVLPLYKGSTLRGAFGHVFKKVVCINREKVCNQCLLKNKCVYSYVFETPPPPDSSKMRKYPYVPHPFVITPPLEKKQDYKREDPIFFQLVLIGKCIDFLPYFIYTFDELGKMGIGKGRGEYQLQEVRLLHPGQNEGIIYSDRDKILHTHFKAIQIDNLQPIAPSPSTLYLNFLTPTRLKYDERLSPFLEFHILFRNLLRRISLLSYFHCGEELDVDFKALIDRAKKIKLIRSDLRWSDWERYSNRQSTKMKMGGLVGEILFEGDFKPFMPYLLLGEYIHVGKGTSFGLGKYKILNLGS